MAIKFLNNSEVTGTLSVSSISNDNATYTGIVVWDGSALKYRTKAQVKSDIGAGSGSVTSIATTSPIQGGTITGSGTISITTATASAIGAGNVNINGGGNKDGLTLSYSGGTATLGVDIQSLPNYSGSAAGADTGSIYMMINNEDDVNNINQQLELGQLGNMINTNNYVSSASFSTANGILTLNRSGLSAVTVDLDGRYVTSSGVTSIATTNGITGGTITSTGTLQVDSTVVRTSGAQTIAGEKTFTNQLAIDTAGGSERMRLYNENNTSPIADSFSGNTSKSYIYFDTVSGSNDPGYIMHESSATETNEGVLHLVPTDDNSDGDYVSIHGTNDADVLKLHTSGLVETVNLQLQLKSGNSVIYLNDGVTIQDDLTVSGGDITLGGTGRIQGVDTVSSGTDAANKTYVDNAVSGLGSGTVTSVATGTGLTGGTITTTGTLSLNLNGLSTTTGAGNADLFAVINTAGSQYKIAAGNINISTFNNNAGYVTSSGVTSVATGSGLTGGTITGSGTVSVDYGTSGLVADAPGGTGTPEQDDYVLVGLDSSSSGETRSFALTDLPFAPSGTVSGVTSVAIAGSTGINVSGSPITSSGTITITNSAPDTGTPAILSNGSTPTLNSGITAAEVRSLIGAGTGSGTITGSGTSGRSVKFNGSTSITNGRIFESASGTFLQDTASYPFQIQNDGGITTAEFEGSSTSNSSNLQITPGTKAKPGINFGQRSGTGAGDTNTGMYSSAADKIEFATGGGERLQISSNGTKLTTLNALSSAASVFLTSDSGIVKTRTAAQVRSDIGAGTGSGTVTSVSGTGSKNGLTLTGTVTTSGNLTLGGTLAISNDDWSGTDLSVANGGTGASNAADARSNLGVVNDTGTPAILSNGSTPSLNSGITGAEVRSLIGAGTGTGTMSSWTIKEGNGTESTQVTNGETVTIAQGTGIQSEMTSTSSGGTITITNTGVTSLTASTGISVSSSTGGVTITNSSPDTGVPAILSNGSVPSLNTGITASEVRELIGAGTGSGTVTGSGTSGRVTYWSGSTSITSTSQFTWNGSTLRIGGSSNSEYSIEVGNGRSGNGYAYIDFVGDTTYTDYGLRIIRGNSGANTSSEITHRGTGNFAITTQDDASFKVQTNGNNERFKIRGNGEAYFGPDGASTSTLYIDTANRKVGFRTESPGSAFDVNGTFRARNELNIGATTEQNFFVEGGSGPRYVKMGAYTPTNKDTWLSGSANTALVRGTAGFGTGGKVLMATYRYTTKIEQGGWPSGSGFANAVNVTPSPGTGKLLIVKDIFVHKTGSNKGSGWSSSTYAVEFIQQMPTSAYAILGGVARSVIVNGDGAWYYSAYNNLFGFSNPQNEQRGTVNSPVKLMLPSAISSSSQPTWYITVEYTVVNLNVWRGNVDQTLT